MAIASSDFFPQKSKEIPSCVFSYLSILNYKPVIEKLSEEDKKKISNVACPKMVGKYFLFKNKTIPKLIETRELFKSYVFFDKDENAEQHVKTLEKIYAEKCSISIFEYISNFSKIEEKKKYLLDSFDKKMDLILKT
ncbi:MAG: hypothetical protein EKK64_10755 [Neisseriaceae bacterium]|nr:MAG: hypothetical protein EKK64_10755 [Neisseriaceae bacterium]